MRRVLSYAGAAASSAVYAYWLETRPRKYHPDTTVWNVTGGIALTGFWVGVETVIAGPPPGTSRRGARWAFAVMCGMFCSTAAPIWAVELYQQRRRVRRLLARLWRRDRNAGPQPAQAARVSSRSGLSEGS